GPRARRQPARHEPGRVASLRPGRELALRHPAPGLQVQHDRHPGATGLAAAREAGRVPTAPAARGRALYGGVRRPGRPRAAGRASRGGACLAPLCAAPRPRDVAHRPRSLHRGARGPPHRDLGPLHPYPSPSLLSRSLRLRSAELSRRLEQLRPAAEPAAQSPAHGRRRDRRDRGRPRRGMGQPAMKPLRFAWVGFHAEGGPAFEALMQAGAPIYGVITLTPERRARRSGAIDYGPLCARYGVPLYEITDINGPDGLAALAAIQPDVAFVIGWSQIVRPPALGLARMGMIGAHASHLPRYRGSAPGNWALIKGETETGNSLIWLAEGVDRGAVSDQAAFSITPYDTGASLYDRVATSNRDILLRLLPQPLAGEQPRQP